MNAPLYRIPGTPAASAPAEAPATTPAAPAVAAAARSVAEVLAESQVEQVLAELDRDLIGLAPVKARIRDIAALLVIDKLRANLGLVSQAPPLHMSFTGNPGTGKTTVAMRMAEILHRLGYVRKGHLVAVTRDDLVGQYIGHTAPKTRDVLKRAMGGVLFIDEAYYLYRPENERDYGVEAIEILLQVMENQRDDLGGDPRRLQQGPHGHLLPVQPGLGVGIAHHLDFPDYGAGELMQIGRQMLAQQAYRFGEGAEDAFARYLERRIAQPYFANARSVRNALDQARACAVRRQLFVRRPRASSRPTTSAPQRRRRHPRQPGVRRGGRPRMSTSLQALIFDVDGTLADTEAAHLAAFNEAFALEGLGWHGPAALHPAAGGVRRQGAHPALLALACNRAHRHRPRRARHRGAPARAEDRRLRARRAPGRWCSRAPAC